MTDLTDVFGDPRLPDRFWAKVTKQDDGCWYSSAAISDRGYAKIIYERKTWYAHRLVWTKLVGPIPPKHEIDHECHNLVRDLCTDPESCLHRRCIRLSHLLCGTHGENMRRGNGVAAVNMLKTHCPLNHPLSGPNLYITPSGGRNCRKCRTRQVYEFYHRNR